MAGKHAGARAARQGDGADLDPDAAADRRRDRRRAFAGLLALLVVGAGIVALTAVWDDPVGSSEAPPVAADASDPPAPSPTGPPPCPTTDDLDGPVTVSVDPALVTVLRTIVRDSGCEGVELDAQPSSEVAAVALADGTLPDVWVPESTLWVVRARPASGTPVAGAIAPEVVADSLAISPVVVATATDTARSEATWRTLIADPGLKIGDPLTSTAALTPLLGARVEADAADLPALAADRGPGPAGHPGRVAHGPSRQ